MGSLPLQTRQTQSPRSRKTSHHSTGASPDRHRPSPRYLHQDQHTYFQIESLFTKWHRSFIYLCYTCRLKDSEAVEAALAEFKDNVIREAIEERFTRLECIAPDQFNLAYFRHTGKWWTTHENITLEAALTTIREYEIYHP